MEKINSENIISALFLLGFNKVDVLLYMCVLAKLTLDNQSEEWFNLEDEDFSFLFCQNIEFDGKVLKIKGNEGLDTTVMVIDGKPYSLRRMLKCNEKVRENEKYKDCKNDIHGYDDCHWCCDFTYFKSRRNVSYGTFY